MKTRKTRLIESTNKIVEQRYLDGKFKEKIENIEPKLNVMPIDGEGFVKRWKISLFVEKPNGSLVDTMNDELLKKLNLKKSYISKESAIEDLQKVNLSDIEI